jgi:hypothetical protein
LPAGIDIVRISAIVDARFRPIVSNPFLKQRLIEADPAQPVRSATMRVKARVQTSGLAPE